MLLRAALLDGAPAAEAWDAVRPGLDIERLERGSSMLLPLVYERLEARGVHDPALAKMKGVYRFVWAGNQIQLSALRELLATLHEASLETIVFGSARLATRYYESSGARRVVEPAVLVRPAEAPEALHILERAGWETDTAHSDRHRVVTRGGTGEQPSCGVHWRLPPELDRALEGPLSADPFRATAVATDIQGAPTAALSGTDELLLSCVSGAKSGGVSRVQWLADVVTILQRTGTEIDWNRLVHEAITRRCVLRLGDALRYAASALDADVPPVVLDELDGEPSSRRERAAHRVSGRGGTVLGNVTPLLAAHLVATQDRSLARSLVTFPGALRASWGLAHVVQLPVGAARRGLAAISAEREFRRHRR